MSSRFKVRQDSRLTPISLVFILFFIAQCCRHCPLKTAPHPYTPRAYNPLVLLGLGIMPVKQEPPPPKNILPPGSTFLVNSVFPLPREIFSGGKLPITPVFKLVPVLTQQGIQLRRYVGHYY